MISTPQKNPWHETDDTPQVRKATAEAQRAASRARTLAASLPDLSRPLENYADNLDVIARAYARDPSSYRRNRALTAVHIPAVAEALEALANLPAGQDEARVAALVADVSTCLSVAQQVRASIEASDLQAAGLSVSVAADQTAPVELTSSSNNTNAFPGSGWMRAGRNAAKDARKRAAAQISDLSEQVLSRASAGSSLTAGYLSSLYEDGIDTISAPVSARLIAARRAFESASVNAIIGGCLVAILFPPAAPLALGLAALEAPDLYAENLERETAAAQEKRRLRRSEREEEIAKNLAILRGRSPIIRMETPCIHITLDLSTGRADGLVLAGRNTGRMLQEIEPREIELMLAYAPDEETKSVLHSWIRRNTA